MAQKERQEQCEARIQTWQEEFAKAQMQQHLQVMAEHRELPHAQAKEQLSRHKHLVQRLGQLEEEEEHQRFQGQAELKESIAGIKERMDLALVL